MQNAVTNPIAFAMLVVVSISASASELSDQQKNLANRGLDFGFVFSELIWNASAKAQLPPADYSGDNAGKALEAMRANYTREFATQRASVKLLDTSLDVAVVAGVVMTGGVPAVLMGSTISYAKTKAMGVLNDEVDRNAKIYLARNLDKFSADNGMDYESLKLTRDPAKIRQAIDSNGMLSEFSASMADDPVAAETLRAAIVRNILNTERLTLDSIAATNVNVADAQEKLTKISKDLHSYSVKVDGAVKELAERATDLEAAMRTSQQAIQSLTDRTETNAKDLKIVGDVLFSQSPPAQKLQLLRAGFYGDLDPQNMRDLVEQLNGEVKKEQFVQGMQKVVGAVNNIGTIAKNLNLDLGPGVDQAISFGNAASQSVTAYMSGNPLAALAAVSGMFGGGSSDPGAARHAAMMAYLKQEFAEVNRKLDNIYQLQIQTMQAIQVLADNLASLQRQMHDRFDALTYEVETIQSITRGLLFEGTNHCFDLRSQWRAQVPSIAISTIPSLTQLGEIAPRNSYSDVEKCLTSLRSLFTLSTNHYSEFAQNPLAVRLAGAVPDGSFPIPPSEKITDYRSKVQSFDEAHYQPSYRLIMLRSKADWPSSTGLLWSFAVPARNISSLYRKISLLKEQKAYCVGGTLLNKPIINLVCPPNEDTVIPLDKLPASPVEQLERRANGRARELLRSAMIQEPMKDLVDLAIFFSAVAETQEPATNKRLATSDEILSQHRIPQGPYLLANALKANTVAIAQGGMLYGDMTALAIYELLWHPTEARFRTVKELAGGDVEDAERDIAYKLLKSNPYLLKNVLMIALDRSIGSQSSGEEIAYRFALAELVRTGDGGQLNSFFHNQLKFEYKNDSSCGPTCLNILSVMVADIDTALPSWSEFAARKLDYPPVVEELERASDALAHRLVAYDIAAVTVRDTNVSLVEQAKILSTFSGK